MRKKKNTFRMTQRNGSVLVLVLLVVLVGFIMGTGLMTLGTQSRITAINTVRDMHARAAADAGLDSALQQINSAVASQSWSAAVVPFAENVSLALTESSYSYKTTYDVADGYEIVSEGTNEHRTRTVRATLKLKGIFDNAIQCKNSVILKSGTVIDAIDSSISMDPADCSEDVVIGTNSTNSDAVVLNMGVVVDGDVVIGPGGDTDTVIKDLGATTDSQYAMTTAAEFPTVTPPSVIGPDSAITVKTLQEATIGTGGDYPATGRFQEIDLGQGARLRVISDCTLYLTGNVDMGQNSEIILDNSKNAKLTIYIDGDWISDNGSGINNQGGTSDFRIFGTSLGTQAIDLKAKGNLVGSIYAPNADLSVFASGNIYGAFIADNFELKSASNVYCDVSLKTVSVTDEGARFIVSRWDEQ